jgi:hypothetical protein
MEMVGMIHKRRLARLRSQSPDLFCTSSNDAHENGVLGNYSLQVAPVGELGENVTLREVEVLSSVQSYM